MSWIKKDNGIVHVPPVNKIVMFIIGICRGKSRAATVKEAIKPEMYIALKI